MRNFFLIILLLSNCVFSQKIKIIDNNTKQGIQYANVLFFNNNKFISGIYSDDSGYIDLLKNKPYDCLKISCIGYENVTLTDFKNFNENQIILNQKVLELNEVVVSRKKFYNLGFVDNKYYKKVGVSKGLEVAVFIANNKNTESVISSFKFKVLKIKDNVRYRIHIYKIDLNNNIPGEELTKINKILTLEKGVKGLIEIDLIDEEIIFPKEGAYVSIEGLDGVDSANKSNIRNNDVNIQFEAFKSHLPIYSHRNFINGVGWINWNDWMPKNYKLTFNIEYEINELSVPSFSLKICDN